MSLSARLLAHLDERTPPLGRERNRESISKSLPAQQGFFLEAYRKPDGAALVIAVQEVAVLAPVLEQATGQRHVGLAVLDHLVQLAGLEPRQALEAVGELGAAQ